MHTSSIKTDRPRSFVPRGVALLACLGTLVVSAIGCADARTPTTSPTPATSSPVSGAQVFAENCAVCHSLPILSSMFEQNRGRAPGFVHDALRQGNMRRMGAHLDEASRRAVAEFFTGVSFDAPEAVRDFRVSPDCDAEHSRFDWDDLAHPNWGRNLGNHRSTPPGVGPDRAEVGKLRVDWVIAFPEASQLRSQPTAAGGALFVGSHNGSVYALDQETGCTRWHFKAATEVRSAVTIDIDRDTDVDSHEPRVRAVFADRAANLYALDAESGELLWKTIVDEHPNAAVTGSVSSSDGLLFVPISSNDDINALDPTYACCTHHGAVVAVDARSGEIEWTAPTVVEEPVVTGHNEIGTALKGPSGASVWNTPTIDPERGLAFIGSGNNHSLPATSMSDSVLALDVETGRVVWTYQSVGGDAWNASCIYGSGSSCPAPLGPDTDFGATTVLGSVEGRPRLFAGQKSGWLHALEPTTGSLVWKKQLARGGAQAGIRYGMAYRDGVLYVPSTNQASEHAETADPQPGIVALSAEDGRLLWRVDGRTLCGGDPGCDGAVTSPPLATEEVVFTTSLDGVLFALDRLSGDVLWRFDTATTFTTLRGKPTRGGGSAGTAGPMYANGRLFVSSGYGQAQRPGNAFIAFSVE